MYDVIIVGGGPAGATLSRLIGKRYKVLLIEKRGFGTIGWSLHINVVEGL